MPAEQTDTMRIWHYRSVPTAPEPDIHVTSYDVDQVRAWLRSVVSSPTPAWPDDPAEAGCISFLNGYLHGALAGPDEPIAAAIADTRRAEIIGGKTPRQIEEVKI